MAAPPTADPALLTRQIKQWALELGFQQAGISDIDLDQAEPQLLEWLANRYHGEMAYMARHGTRRSRPAELVAGTLRVISVRLDYLPRDDAATALLANPTHGYIARYALGRDYHKLMRRKLQQLATQIRAQLGDFGYRPFVDSAPVMEKPLAEKAGLGWQGKHTNLVNRRDGGWFFLGELYTDLALPVDTPAENHCGRCRACLDCCPTAALVAPYQLDARRCISYLTIEHPGAIPVELRPLLGNRIYGCDDCLLACPWNRFAKPTREADFLPRHGLERPRLSALLDWREEEFLQRLEGSPIRRIGFQRWQRNLAVALGNSPRGAEEIAALQRALPNASALVREHLLWALCEG